jgi:hypothetical protein
MKDIARVMRVSITNYKITQLPNKTVDFAGERQRPSPKSKESGRHEGSGISKKDLRQVQDRAPQGRGACDLRELETQTKTGVGRIASIARIAKE